VFFYAMAVVCLAEAEDDSPILSNRQTKTGIASAIPVFVKNTHPLQ
jgi:hypothetical protein